MAPGGGIFSDIPSSVTRYTVFQMGQIDIWEEVSIGHWKEIGRLLKVWKNTTGFALTFKNGSSVLTGWKNQQQGMYKLTMVSYMCGYLRPAL